MFIRFIIERNLLSIKKIHRFYALLRLNVRGLHIGEIEITAHLY